MLDSVSLVHMNGRVYDPYLGRFTSADTVIQNLVATESVNPYAYAWNDPLKYVDPSGHSLLGDIIGVAAAIAAIYFLPELAPALFPSETAISTLAVAGFVGGFVGAYVSTGSLSASLTAGLIAGVTATAFAELGGYVAQMQAGSEWTKPFAVLAHAAVGCASTAASGGNCGRGALAAGISEAAYQTGYVESPAKSLASWGTFRGAAEAGLIGGVAAKITGGKFDDGFTVSAAGYLFNAAADRIKKQMAIQAKIDATMSPLVGKQFDSTDAAALAIVNQTALRQISAEYDIEIGVEFYRLPGMPDGSVIVGNAVTQFLNYTVNPIEGLVMSPPPGPDNVVVWAGYLHTHANGSDMMGWDDAATGSRLGTPYLWAPSGSLIGLDVAAWRAAGSPVDPSKYTRIVR
jgi:RHS repeat-associated protein